MDVTPSAAGDPRVRGNDSGSSAARARLAPPARSLRSGTLPRALRAPSAPARGARRARTGHDCDGDSGERGRLIGYAYESTARRYTWSVAPSAVPRRAPSFPIVDPPEEPSFNRPGADRGVGVIEVKSNRAFAWKLVAGVFDLSRPWRSSTSFRSEAPPRRRDRASEYLRGYRSRLVLTGVLFSPLLALVLGWHALDAAAKGESLAPVVLGALLGLAALVPVSICS